MPQVRNNQSEIQKINKKINDQPILPTPSAATYLDTDSSDINTPTSSPMRTGSQVSTNLGGMKTPFFTPKFQSCNNTPLQPINKPQIFSNSPIFDNIYPILTNILPSNGKNNVSNKPVAENPILSFAEATKQPAKLKSQPNVLKPQHIPQPKVPKSQPNMPHKPQPNEPKPQPTHKRPQRRGSQLSVTDWGLESVLQLSV